MRERLGQIVRWSVLPLLVGLVLAGLGPFGSYSAPFWRRLLLWIPVVWINWALAEATLRQALRHLPQRLPMRTLTVPLLASLLVSPLALAVVFGVAALVGEPLGTSAWQIYWQVLLVTAAAAVPAYAWSVARSNRAAAALDQVVDSMLAEAAREREAGFERRWPARLQGRLLFLEMEDHSLRIHTDRGSDVILCRMEDAAQELGARGLRVHRSYWVAAGAVAGARRDGQSWRLRLVDGREVPVGRTYRPAVKDAGWLQRS